MHDDREREPHDIGGTCRAPETPTLPRGLVFFSPAIPRRVQRRLRRLSIRRGIEVVRVEARQASDVSSDILALLRGAVLAIAGAGCLIDLVHGFRWSLVAGVIAISWAQLALTRPSTELRAVRLYNRQIVTLEDLEAAGRVTPDLAAKTARLLEIASTWAPSHGRLQPPWAGPLSTPWIPAAASPRCFEAARAIMYAASTAGEETFAQALADVDGLLDEAAEERASAAAERVIGRQPMFSEKEVALNAIRAARNRTSVK